VKSECNRLRYTRSSPPPDRRTYYRGQVDNLLPMTRILVMSETRSLADVKAHLSEIIDLVESQHERVVITRHGRPAAVILSPDDLAAIEETLDILSAPGALLEIRAAEAEVDEGAYLTAAELRAKYLHKD
jgi:antitoxin YefM